MWKCFWSRVKDLRIYCRPKWLKYLRVRKMRLIVVLADASRYLPFQNSGNFVQRILNLSQGYIIYCSREETSYDLNFCHDELESGVPAHWYIYRPTDNGPAK